MVSVLLPVAFVGALWFAGTALVVALDRGAQVLGALGALALVAVELVWLLRDDGGTGAAYAGFAAAFVIWGWHELAFLTGTVTGTNRAALPSGTRGWARFRASAATVIHHELALAATVALLLALTWGSANATGAHAFALLFALRLSAKLNLFLGVPNFSPELLPARLAYLKSHFRIAPMNALMPFSLAACALGAVLLWRIDEPLLAALAAIGFVEHLFLILPFQDGALWRWAMPARKQINGEV